MRYAIGMLLAVAIFALLMEMSPASVKPVENETVYEEKAKKEVTGEKDVTVQTKDELKIYAQSAVLMDDST